MKTTVIALQLILTTLISQNAMAAGENLMGEPEQNASSITTIGLATRSSLTLALAKRIGTSMQRGGNRWKLAHKYCNHGFRGERDLL